MEYEPGAIPTQGAAELWEWGKLLDSPYQAPPWIVDQILPDNGKIMIAAKEGTGKSVLGLQLANHIASGTPFLGTYAVDKPRKVLYLQSEGDLGDTAQRGHDMNLWVPGPDTGMLYMAFLLKRKINTNKGRDSLRELCEQVGLGGGVIIIDPVYPTIQGSAKDDEPVSVWTDNVNLVAHEFRSAVIAFQHEHRSIRDLEGKKVKEGIGEKTFGSYVWRAWASYGFELQQSAGKNTAIHLRAWKQRRPTSLWHEDDPELLTMIEPSPLAFVRHEEGVTQSMASVRALLTVYDDPFTKDEIVAIMSKYKKGGFKTTAVQDAVNNLRDRGDILEAGDKNPMKYTVNPERVHIWDTRGRE